MGSLYTAPRHFQGSPSKMPARSPALVAERRDLRRSPPLERGPRGDAAAGGAALLSVGLIPFLFDLSNYYFAVLAVFGMYWSVSRGAAYGLGVVAWLSWLPLALLRDAADEFAALTWMVLILTVALTVALARRTDLNQETEVRPDVDVSLGK